MCKKIGNLKIVSCRFSDNSDGLSGNGFDVFGYVPDEFKPKETVLSISSYCHFGLSIDSYKEYCVPSAFAIDTSGQIKGGLGSAKVFRAYITFIY